MILKFLSVLKVFALFVCLVLCPLSYVFAQEGGAVQGDFSMAVNIMQSVMVASDAEFDVEFSDGLDQEFDVDAQNIGEARSNELAKPAQIRIMGAPVMAMVQVEMDEMTVRDNDEVILSVYDFDVGQKDAGSSVTIMPFSDEEVILLGIGGKVKENTEDEDSYIGANVVSVNYL